MVTEPSKYIETFEEMLEDYQPESSKIFPKTKHGKIEKVTYHPGYGKNPSKEDGDVFIRKILFNENNDIVELFKQQDKLPSLLHLNEISGAATDRLDNSSKNSTIMICEFLSKHEPLLEHLEEKFKTKKEKKGVWSKFFRRDRDLEKLELEVCKIAKDVCKGLKSLHKLNFLHLDIKPQNIMVPKEEKNDYEVLKIIDYDCVWHFTNDDEENKKRYATREPRLTIGFAAPEVLPGGFQYGIPGKYSDVFSVGALIKSLLPDDYLTRDHFVRPRLQSVIEKCMEINPKDRYQDMDELIKAIELAEKSYLSRLYNSFKNVIFGALGISIIWSLLMAGLPIYHYEMNVLPQLQQEIEEQNRKLESFQQNLISLDMQTREKHQALLNEYEKLKNTVHGEDIEVRVPNSDGTNTLKVKVSKDGESDINQDLKLMIELVNSKKKITDPQVTIEFFGACLKPKNSNGILNRSSTSFDNNTLCHRFNYYSVGSLEEMNVDIVNNNEILVIEVEKPFVKFTLTGNNITNPISQRIPIEIIKE